MPNVHVRLHDWTNQAILDGVRDGRLQLGLIVRPPKASSLRDLRYEELFHERFVWRFPRSIRLPDAGHSVSEVATEPLIGLTHEDYPEYYDYLSITFSKVKQKPRVVEEHDSMAGILSSVEAGAGVAFGGDVFGYSFGPRVKVLHLTPEPNQSRRPGRAQRKLSPAAEKFWHCAKRNGGQNDTAARILSLA
jgi:LysR substrate binding domain.